MCLSKLCTLLSLADDFFKLFSDISKQIFSKILDANQHPVVDVVEYQAAIQRDPASSER